MVMRVGGPQAPSPPSPGRLSCTRTLYPVFGLRFIKVTFSLGSTEEGMQQHTSFGRFQKPPFSLQPFLPLMPLSLLSFSPHSYPMPLCHPSSLPTHPQWRTRPWCCPGAGSAGGQR